ncbi:hypothetical protein ALMA_0824 [Alloscardovia macacae]|uniref:Uncharacterized protein n=1 Tax=Alloscardovia macacae TaxID=1160091 RepID=A0A261F5Q6_9BIFI|nr:hypothetical protein ALMA_0824 [Alloscardovia macacae]
MTTTPLPSDELEVLFDADEDVLQYFDTEHPIIEEHAPLH